MQDEVALAPLRWINVANGDEVFLVRTEDVCFFQSDHKYTRVVTAKGEGLIRKSIKELLPLLDPGSFRQVHRSMIVNLAAVHSVSRDDAGHVVVRMKGFGGHFVVSRQFAAQFRQM